MALKFSFHSIDPTILRNEKVRSQFERIVVWPDHHFLSFMFYRFSGLADSVVPLNKFWSKKLRSKVYHAKWFSAFYFICLSCLVKISLFTRVYKARIFALINVRRVFFEDRIPRVLSFTTNFYSIQFLKNRLNSVNRNSRKRKRSRGAFWNELLFL